MAIPVFQKKKKATGPQGPKWPGAQMGLGPKWAGAQMGPGPKWSRAQMGPGPKWGPGPNGPGPKWGPGPNCPGAQMGPGPSWGEPKPQHKKQLILDFNDLGWFGMVLVDQTDLLRVVQTMFKVVVLSLFTTDCICDVSGLEGVRSGYT